MCVAGVGRGARSGAGGERGGLSGTLCVWGKEEDEGQATGRGVGGEGLKGVRVDYCV